MTLISDTIRSEFVRRQQCCSKTCQRPILNEPEAETQGGAPLDIRHRLPDRLEQRPLRTSPDEGIRNEPRSSLVEESEIARQHGGPVVHSTTNCHSRVQPHTSQQCARKVREGP